jgi:hypothetical protein
VCLFLDAGTLFSSERALHRLIVRDARKWGVILMDREVPDREREREAESTSTEQP